MRTLIPPQFTDDDRQRLLTLALTAPPAEAQRSGADHPQWREPTSEPAGPAAADAWDESW